VITTKGIKNMTEDCGAKVIDSAKAAVVGRKIKKNEPICLRS